MKKKSKSKLITHVNQPSFIPDTSPVIPQRSKIKNNLTIYERPLTDNQKKFLEISRDKNTKIMFVTGPAGTSKTFMSVLSALKLMNERRISDLIYVRSAVECSDSKLGFLPGESTDKMRPYIQPLLDKLEEMLPKNEIDYLDKDNRITSIPIGYLRGLNFNAKVIICDEGQNMTFKELFTLITRTGEFSKVFILGDPEQSDINGRSGFTKMMSMFNDEDSIQNGIHCFQFNEEDIVRSGLVKYIIKKTRTELQVKK